jgi:DNA helicase-2/ATP-dependent DNA helicase PcrA
VSRAKSTLAETEADLDNIVDDLDLDVPDDERPLFVERAADILGACYRDTRTCDFDDMIWLAVRHNVRVPTFDFVFVDETQDLNAAQIELAFRAVKRDGRAFAVGDDRQAIYAFRGADEHAVDRVTHKLAARVLPLSITYRCGKAIVALAQAIVPDYEAAPSAPDGLVRQVTDATMRTEATPGDFVISRKNAPLIGLCLGFLAQGKPATIAGRDIGAGLLALVNKSKATTIPALLAFVDAWEKAEIDRLTARKRDTQVATDKAECITALTEGASTVAEVKARIEALFSDKDDSKRIVCTTTHKAKGLERDRVWVLADTFSTTSTEEDNLWYVAITRAKTELCILGQRRTRRSDRPLAA